MIDLSGAEEAGEYFPDAEWQLAINAYRNIRRTLGRGTLAKLQVLIELKPLTKRTSGAELGGIDLLIGDD